MIYILFLLLTAVFAVKYDTQKDTSGKRKSFYFLLFAYVLLSGLRYKIGGDTISYMKGYETMSNLYNLSSYEVSHLRYQPLWTYFVSTCKTISSEFYVFQLIHAFISNLIIFLFIRKFSSYVFTTILCYAILNFLEFNTESLRETLAIASFLLGFKYLDEGNWIKFLFFAFLAWGFHISAIILIVSPLFYYLRWSKVSLIIYFSFILFLPSLYLKLPEYWSYFNFTNDEISSRFEIYYNDKEYTAGLNYYILHYLRWLIFPLLSLFVFNKLAIVNYKYSSFVLAMVLFASLSLYSVAFYRFTNYFIPFYWILLANLFWAICNKMRLRTIDNRFFACVLYASMLIILVYYKQFKSYNGYTSFDRYYPYISIFEQ